MPRSMWSLAECHQVARVLQDYLDGELDVAGACRVAAHLEGCWYCGLEASLYEAIKVAVVAVSTQGGSDSGDAVERARAFADDLAGARP